jgi:hypothetical protein
VTNDEPVGGPAPARRHGALEGPGRVLRVLPFAVVALAGVAAALLPGPATPSAWYGLATVVALIVASGACPLLPIVLVGPPRYGPGEWRQGLLWTITDGVRLTRRRSPQSG